MKTTHDIINDSGYPLQIHLENLIASTTNRHNWGVLVKEHRWVNAESNDEGFIDLVLESTTSFVKLVVECKRVTGNWTFLLPNLNPSPTSKTRMLYAQYAPFSFMWKELKIAPESDQSAFCVMEVDGKKDSRTLEKLSGGVLLSLECLAQEEMNLRKGVPRHQLTRPGDDEYYIPVIVTTAKLQKCLFDPNSVNTEDGKIPTGSEIAAVKFIRFRKNLATTLQYEKPYIIDLQESNLENDRTVFVVQAKHFVDFLALVPGR